MSTAATHPYAGRRNVLSANLVLFAAPLSAAIAAAAIALDIHHFEYIALAAQFLLLLPALLYARPPKQPAVYPFHDTPRARRFIVAAFLAAATLSSWRISQGVAIADEDAYRFQARIFASGHLMAPPPPGTGIAPRDAARPVHWAHEICWRGGWYSKYPWGWPAILAFPQKAGLGFLATPILGALLLLIAGAIARRAFGPAATLPAVAAAALSPYVLAYSVGAMSHALAAVLVAAATLACLEAIATRRLSWLIAMNVCLIATLHVRPFTGLVAAAVLGLSVPIATRRHRPFLIRALAIGAAAALIAAFTLGLYNLIYTGDPLRSPYAFAAGTALPREVNLPLAEILRNLRVTWRHAAQNTWIASFPFIFPLAVYGFLAHRRTAAARILAALFCATIAATLLVNESSSIVGERFWFESFFAIVILGALGFIRLWETRPPARPLAASAMAGLALGQLFMLAAWMYHVDRAADPRRQVRALAEIYRNCDCVVFLADNPPFFAAHLNLNNPDWPRARVFYAIDPGPGARADWARRLGHHHFEVITYQP